MTIKGLFVVVLGVFFVHGLVAQQHGRQVADSLYRAGDYVAAVDAYLQYLTERPDDVVGHIRLGRCYEQMGDLQSAKVYFEELLQKLPEDRALYRLYGDVLKKMMRYEEAMAAYARYAEENPEEAAELIRGCRIARELMAAPQGCVLEPLPTNSPYTDAFPMVYGGAIVYLSERGRMWEEWQTKGEDAPRVAGKAMYYAVRGGQAPLSFDQWMEFADGIVSTSADGALVAWMTGGEGHWLRAIDALDDDGRVKIVLARYDSDRDRWVKEDFPHNAEDASTGFPYLTPDGNTLYFASNREGGYGKYDLYVSHYRDGFWTDPVNLGPHVNTPGNEITPYLRGDTLYFASDWYDGLGGYDIFRIRRVADQWRDRENLGACVNSPHNDYGWVIDGEGRAYFTSDRPVGKGRQDIYVVTQSSEKGTDQWQTKDASPLEPIVIPPQKLKTASTHRPLPVIDLSKLLVDTVAVLRPEVEENGRYYCIQLAALRHPTGLKERFAPLSRYGEVYSLRSGAWIKVRLGCYSTKEQALAILKKVRQQGWPQAFIVYEDEQTRAKHRHIAGAATVDPTATDLASSTQEGAKSKSASTYKVRVVAYRPPTTFHTSVVSDLGRIEHWTKGDWRIIVIGDYHTLEEAKRVLATVKERGYHDAFIVVERNGLLEKWEGSEQ